MCENKDTSVKTRTLRNQNKPWWGWGCDHRIIQRELDLMVYICACEVKQWNGSSAGSDACDVRVRAIIVL